MYQLTEAHRFAPDHAHHHPVLAHHRPPQVQRSRSREFPTTNRAGPDAAPCKWRRAC
jgi:hypothetical protein